MGHDHAGHGHAHGTGQQEDAERRGAQPRAVPLPPHGPMMRDGNADQQPPSDMPRASSQGVGFTRVE